MLRGAMSSTIPGIPWYRLTVIFLLVVSVCSFKYVKSDSKFYHTKNGEVEYERDGKIYRIGRIDFNSVKIKGRPTATDDFKIPPNQMKNGKRHRRSASSTAESVKEKEQKRRSEYINKDGLEECLPMEYEDQPTNKAFVMNHDDKILWLGVVIPIMETDFKINPRRGMTNFQSLRYAVELANAGMKSLLMMGGWTIRLRRLYPSVNLGDPSLIRYGFKCRTSNVTAFYGPFYQDNYDVLAAMTHIYPITFMSQSSSKENDDRLRYQFGKSKNQIHKYTLQTNPSTLFRNQVILDLILKFGWNFVAVFHSSFYIGESTSDVIFLLDKSGICIPSTRLKGGIEGNTDENIKARIIELRENHPTLSVLLLLTDVADTRSVLKAIKELDLQNHFTLLFADRGVNDIEVVRGYEDIAVGAITIEPVNFHEKHLEQLADFEQWMLKANPTNTRNLYFHWYWEQTFECELNSHILDRMLTPDQRGTYQKKCTGDEQFQIGKGVYPDRNLFRGAMDTVEAIVFTLYRMELISTQSCEWVTSNKDLINIWSKDGCDKCPWNTTLCFNRFFEGVFPSINMLNYQRLLPDIGWSLKYNHPRDIPNASYEISNFIFTNGRYQSVPIGNWTIKVPAHETKVYFPTDVLKMNKPHMVIDTDRIFWRNGSAPEGKCALDCAPGYTRLYYLSKREVRKCCWKCEKCDTHDIVVENKCHRCDRFQTPNIIKNVCEPLPIYHITLFSNSFATVLGIASMLGIIIVIAFGFILIYNNNKHVIKAAGRELSYCMLSGIFFLFISTILFLVYPSKSICIARFALPPMAQVVVYSSFLLKNIRLYRIFERYDRKVTQPYLISPKSQVIILLIIMSFQIGFAFIWTYDGLPDVTRVLTSNEKQVMLMCTKTHKVRFVLNYFPAIFIIAACCIYCYKIRGLPKTYNETKFYIFTAFCSFTLLLTFMVTFQLIEESDNYYHDMANAIYNVLIAYLIILTLFVPRLMYLRHGDVPPFTANSFLRDRSVSGGSRDRAYSFQRNRTPSNNDYANENVNMVNHRD